MNLKNGIERLDFHRDLGNRVYEITRNLVISPSTPPGTRLYEEEIAQEIGVSRTPVRAALHRLEQEGIVKTIRNRGAYKVHFKWQELYEIVKIRAELECLSFEVSEQFGKKINIQDIIASIPDITSFEEIESTLNYPECDKRFHEELIKSEKESWIGKTVQNQDTALHMFRLVVLKHNAEFIKSSIEEHMRIVEALKRDDISLAKTCVMDHWSSCLDRLVQYGKAYPGLFS